MSVLCKHRNTREKIVIFMCKLTNSIKGILCSDSGAACKLKILLNKHLRNSYPSKYLYCKESFATKYFSSFPLSLRAIWSSGCLQYGCWRISKIIHERSHEVCAESQNWSQFQRWAIFPPWFTAHMLQAWSTKAKVCIAKNSLFVDIALGLTSCSGRRHFSTEYIFFPKVPCTAKIWEGNGGLSSCLSASDALVPGPA